MNFRVCNCDQQSRYTTIDGSKTTSKKKKKKKKKKKNHLTTIGDKQENAYILNDVGKDCISNIDQCIAIEKSRITTVKYQDAILADIKPTTNYYLTFYEQFKFTMYQW